MNIISLYEHCFYCNFCQNFLLPNLGNDKLAKVFQEPTARAKVS